MKISTRSIMITFIIVFFVSAIFLSVNPPAMQSLPDDFRTGRVLGVSEAMANRSFQSLGYELPKNEFRPFLPPKKIEKGVDFSLNGCVGAVLDSRTGVLIYGQGADRQMPIASITKLVTALVFMDTKPNWEAVYKVKDSDRVEGGKIYVFTGEEIKVRDLFYLSIVASANTATKALTSSTGLSEKEFVARMNDKAKELGLKMTSFVDPVGISESNVSTAAEVTKIANEALKNKYIQEASLTEKYEFYTVGNVKKTVYNTDLLLDIFPENGIKISGGKTGYTDLAGYCFVGKFIDEDGNIVISAVLGGETQNSRFHETRNIIAWTYKAFQWPR